MNIQVFSGHLAGKPQSLTSSRIVAGVFNKEHGKVLRSIRNLDCSEGFRLANFGETVAERANPSGGAAIKSLEYQMTRDGFMFLTMGFTGAEAARRKEAFIAAFNDMEAALLQRPALAGDGTIAVSKDEYIDLLRTKVAHLEAQGRKTHAKPRPFTDDEKARMRDMVADGESVRAIARALGRAEASVRGHLYPRIRAN